MKLQTQIPIEKAGHQIDYSSELLLLGSCFVENMGDKLEYFKFKSIQNPFGILFNPISIETLISKSIRNYNYAVEDIFYHNERWHCFDVHSDLSDESKEGLLQKLNDAIKLTHQQILNSTHIIITLGTARVYRSNESKAIVANCHKIPQKQFTKVLLSVKDIVGSLKNIITMIQDINPNVQFIFTVSPVRHLKDGFVENQRSKAHLISAIGEVLLSQEQSRKKHYFPSYELMMDELRDYRFYATDMVHPNQLAIDYIWEKFIEVWISKESYPTMEKVDAIQKGIQHRAFNYDSKQHQKFLSSLREKIHEIQKDHPFIDFTSMK